MQKALSVHEQSSVHSRLFYYSSYFIQLFPKNAQGGRIILDRNTLIFFSDLEFFGYALYAIVYICNTIWYRITRLGNSRVTEQIKTSKIRRKNGNNQFPLRIAIFSITEHSHWRIIWMRLKISAFGYFMFVVLERRKHSFVLRT